eukprot:TRINITY_DN1313_c0_g2_i2.p1 TRINITY_DN1313_c0_g2~~TRINITY_DN1313_c0_g2_i2.p1  ORF type:complete len:656 (-),score=215.71 TRINITY_DN1313_c0_g2_i2:273-1979(-)
MESGPCDIFYSNKVVEQDDLIIQQLNEEESQDEQGSDTIVSDEKDKRKRIKIRRIIGELLLTEEKYVNYLDSLVMGYIEPIKTEFPDFAEKFKSITSILRINKILLEEIIFIQRIPVEPGWDEIDDVILSLSERLLKMVPYFKIYSQYVNNYDDGLSLYSHLYTTRKFKNFIKKQTDFIKDQYKDKLETVLAISDLLIMPIQRIPRYVLLLKEINKSLDDSLESRGNLIESINAFSELATHINDTKKQRDELQLLMGVQKDLTTSLGCPLSVVSPNRRLIKEGTVYALFEGAPVIKPGYRKKLHFFLFNDCILISSYMNENQGRSAGLKFVSVFSFHKKSFDSFAIDKLDDDRFDDGYGFQIYFLTMKKKIGACAGFSFLCPLIGDRDIWYDKIKAAVNEIVSSSHIHHEPENTADDAMEMKTIFGWMYKLGDNIKTWRRHFFKLKGKSLFYFSKPDSTQIIGTLNLRDFVLHTSTKAENSFELHSKKTNYIIYFKISDYGSESRAYYSIWCNMIADVCDYEDDVFKKWKRLTMEQRWNIINIPPDDLPLFFMEPEKWLKKKKRESIR